ncbi:MAG: transglycosylase SLT domain-containing protein [Myxococcales bacterium]|nr:transglycosylase SLT domain-containing protein [Myxococcales bacterium]
MTHVPAHFPARRLLGLLTVVAITAGQQSIARAQPGPTVPGPIRPGPGPSADNPRVLVQDLRQRRAIRGCTVGDSCQGAIQEALTEFELEAFPQRNSDSPWAPASSVHGHTAVRKRGKHGDRIGAPGARSKAVSVRKPSELRPDLPWLDDLKMPDVPVHWDERIIKFLEFYRYDPRGRNIMTAWLRDQNKYKGMMLRNLRKHKLPEALLYISMIESSYSPHEYSRVGASGLWQFMPASGRIYGLTQNRWLDERNDPGLSTEAVTFYFKDLYDRFGDWDLAMAAFNAGYGAVIKSIAKYNTNSYWQLLEYENGLPWGTSHYVPKWLATAIVGNNLEVFGFADIKGAVTLEWEEAVVPKSVALAIVAQAAGTDKATIEKLNPQLRRGRTPPHVSNYRVRIPMGSKSKFGERFAQLRADWDDVDAYVVKHGERFEDVATTHGIARSKLRKLNGLATESEVRGGMILVVPKVSQATKTTNETKARESLYKSGVPAASDGEALLMPVPNIDFKVKGKKRYFHRIVSGATLGGTAEAFDVKTSDLAFWNGLDVEAHLHPRMVLQVWVSKKFSPTKHGVAVMDESRLRIVESGSEEHLNEAERRIGRKRVSYEPKRPESLETIGAKYGLGRYDLARINHLSPSSIVSPGESILVYEVVDAKKSQRAADQSKTARRNKGKQR